MLKHSCSEQVRILLSWTSEDDESEVGNGKHQLILIALYITPLLCLLNYNFKPYKKIGTHIAIRL